jgi:putative membrane protein
MRMSESRRLHPISAVTLLLKQLKELLLPFIAILLFGGSGKGIVWKILIAAGTILYLLIYGVLSWLRFTYRIEDGELRIESGIFIRKKRYIPFERIQSIDVSEGILQRPFGLVKLTIETAGSSTSKEAEAVLSAITKEEAKAIQDCFFTVKNNGKNETVEVKLHQDIIYTLSPKHLVLLASTSGGAGVVISAVIAFVFQFNEYIPYKAVYSELREFIANGLVFVSLIVFLIFLLAWIIALIGTMFKYANFTVRKSENDLVISQGLLEKRQITIPLNRIQGIRISENLLRQPLGYATVLIVSAGGSSAKESSSKVHVLPIIKKTQIKELLSPILADFHFNSEIVTIPKRALKRYLLKLLIPTIILILPAIIFFRPWGYFSFILLPVTVSWAFLRFKDAGWNINDSQLTLSFRGIIKHTVLIKKNKIQSLWIGRSNFQKKLRLNTVDASIKSGEGISGGAVTDIDEQDAIKIYNWYKH